jgi:two-component system chemotaxis response regulator CheB
MQRMLYTAPPDHVLLEDDRTSLDVSEVVNFSRPSIDVLFESFHLLYKKNVWVFFVWSNNDGAKGLKLMAELNGKL